MEFDSKSPIWAQLVAEFQRLIAIGAWKPGERIPSTRELALTYRVNPNTVQRAVQELDRLGYTEVERAAGRTVTGDSDAANSLQAALATAIIAKAIEELKQINIKEKQAIEIFQKGWSSD